MRCTWKSSCRTVTTTVRRKRCPGAQPGGASGPVWRWGLIVRYPLHMAGRRTDSLAPVTLLATDDVERLARRNALPGPGSRLSCRWLRQQANSRGDLTIQRQAGYKRSEGGADVRLDGRLERIPRKNRSPKPTAPGHERPCATFPVVRARLAICPFESPHRKRSKQCRCRRN